MKKMEIMDEDVRITLDILIPGEEKEKYPVVIYSHGLGAGTKSGYRYAKTVTERGFVMVCFDFPGGGEGNREIPTTQMSVMTEAHNLRAIIREVKKLPFTDENKLFLMGSSQGGMVSALVAADSPEDFEGLILIYPAFVIPSIARELLEGEGELPYEYEIMGITLGRKYALDVIDLDVRDVMKRFDREVLIIHGDMDEYVPISYSNLAERTYPNAALHVLYGARHGFNDIELEKANSIVGEYLKKKQCL